MRLHQIAATAFLFLICGVSSADAQYGFGESHRDIEITPFAGGRFGGVINLPAPTQPLSNTVDYLGIDSNYDYGVMGDVNVLGNIQAEFMWSRQPSTLGAHEVTGQTTPAGNVNVDVYQWSLLYPFRDRSAKLRPYIAGGIGFTHWGTSVPGTLPFTNNVSFNLGGGAKYFFARHYGVRVDFRWVPSRTTSELGEFFDPFFGPYFANINNYAQQTQLNGGLIFRF